MLKSLLNGAIGAALLSACAAAPTAAAPPTPAEAPQDANPALFLVEDEDTKIYLFGTIHILGEDKSWFHDQVEAAFQASDELIVEAVSPGDAELQKIVMAKAIDTDGPPLSETLSPEYHARLTAELQEWGVPASGFEIMDPWFAGMNLSALTFAKLGMTAEGGVEARLQQAAADAGKPISGFETMEYQLGLFDSLPEAEQIAFLEQALDEMDQAETVAAGMVDAWRRGDLDALDKVVNDDMDDPVLRERILVGRNRDWAEKIEARMARPGTVFVAVGAGHLAGKDNVQSALAARGLSVRRVE